MTDQEKRDVQLAARLDSLQRELDRERRTRRLMLGVVVAAVVTIPLGVGALGPVPHVLVAGTPVAASDLNENFQHLQDGVTAVEARQTGRYCGTSAGSTTGDAGGYAGISSLCGSAAGCSSAARICLTSEIVLTLAEGGTLSSGAGAWMASGEAHGGSNECSGFTDASAARTAPIWTASPGLRSCDESHPVLCCE